MPPVAWATTLAAALFGSSVGLMMGILPRPALAATFKVNHYHIGPPRLVGLLQAWNIGPPRLDFSRDLFFPRVWSTCIQLLGWVGCYEEAP